MELLIRPNQMEEAGGVRLPAEPSKVIRLRSWRIDHHSPTNPAGAAPRSQTSIHAVSPWPAEACLVAAGRRSFQSFERLWVTKTARCMSANCQVMSDCPAKSMPSMSGAYRTHRNCITPPLQLTYASQTILLYIVRCSKLCTSAALKGHQFHA